jgi:hypothetical protein
MKIARKISYYLRGMNCSVITLECGNFEGYVWKRLDDTWRWSLYTGYYCNKVSWKTKEKAATSLINVCRKENENSQKD